MYSTPPGTWRRRLLPAGLTAAAVLVGLAPAMPASAAGAQADLVVAASVDPTQVVDTGGSSAVTADVRNAGSKPTRGVTLTLSLPDGAWFFSDGFTVAASWTCDIQPSTTTTVHCAHAGLAAGESPDPVTIPFGVPAGTAGDSLTVTAGVATPSAEASLADNTAQATVTYIPGTVDLVLSGMPADADMVVGDTSSFTLDVRNAGTSPSGDVTVTLALPAGVTGSIYGDNWTCSPGAGTYACTHAPLLSGWSAEPIWGNVTISSGNPGDALTVTATATTSTPDAAPDDNTGQTTFTLLQPATITGTVWVDADHDGVRDPDEQGAPVGVGGLVDVAVLATDGFPSGTLTVNPDGTYVAQVRPKSYQVRFQVEDPYAFIDSADSDVVGYDNSSYDNYGASAVFTAVAGQTTVVDAAVAR